MKLPFLAAGLLTAAMSTPAHALTLTFAGQLSDNGLPRNNDYDNASFAGWVEVDLSDLTANNSSAITYSVDRYSVTLTPTATATPTLTWEGDGETGEDDSTVAVIKTDSELIINLYENIDDTTTAALERRLIQMTFDADTAGRVDTLTDLIAADPTFGASAKFAAGLLQFTTSQSPTSIETAQVTADMPTVPLPATLPLLGFALGGLAVFGRTRRSA